MIESVTLTYSVEVVPLTPQQIAEGKASWTRAFDWVMQEVDVDEENSCQLLDFLLNYRNGERIKWAEFDSLQIDLEWPRAETWLLAQRQERYDEVLDEIDTMSAEDAVCSLKMADLRTLIRTYGVTIKGRRKKLEMADAMLALLTKEQRGAAGDEAKRMLRQHLLTPDVTLHDLVELLVLRISRARYRMERAPQIIGSVAHHAGLYDYTHIKAWTFGYDENEIAPCGLRDQEIRPVSEMIDVVKQPLCDALNCACTFSPFSPELEAYLRSER